MSTLCTFLQISFYYTATLLHSFLHVGQGQCFTTYLPKFFLRSFQTSFENCAPFLKIFFGRSSQILAKTFSKEVSKMCILSLEKKSSKNLPKEFSHPILVDDVICDVSSCGEDGRLHGVAQELMCFRVGHVQSQADWSRPVVTQQLQHLKPVCT